MDSRHVVHLCLRPGNAVQNIPRQRDWLNLRRRTTSRVEVNLLAWAVGHRRSVDACCLRDGPLGVAHELDVVNNLRALLVVQAL